jgi:hypothetical protein
MELESLNLGVAGEVSLEPIENRWERRSLVDPSRQLHGRRLPVVIERHDEQIARSEVIRCASDT